MPIVIHYLKCYIKCVLFKNRNVLNQVNPVFHYNMKWRCRLLTCHNILLSNGLYQLCLFGKKYVTKTHFLPYITLLMNQIRND